MNKLRRDIRSYTIGLLVLSGGFIGLGIFKLVQVLSGLGEQEFYKRYPASRWIAVSLGLIFIIALVYSAKKRMDIHPNIQLRSKPDEVLEKVLDDPEYLLWHTEAQRLLDKRHPTSDCRGTT